MHDLTPRRRRLSAALLVLGAFLGTFGLFINPAQAAGSEPVFGPGYDSYLMANQRGIAGSGVEQQTDCPTNAVVSGMVSWHFVLKRNTHGFATLDVAFRNILPAEPSDFTLTGLTPKTTAEWAGFDPATNFITFPSPKHAYVYTPSMGIVRDAASQDTPNSPGPNFVLSHVCDPPPTTTTTTVLENTTTTTVPENTTTTTTTTVPETTTTTTVPETTTTTTVPENTTTTTVPENTTTTTVPENTTTTTVLENTTTVPETTTTEPPPSVLATVVTAAVIADPDSIPRTGSSSTEMLVFAGGALILAGLVTLRLGREQTGH